MLASWSASWTVMVLPWACRSRTWIRQELAMSWYLGVSRCSVQRRLEGSSMGMKGALSSLVLEVFRLCSWGAWDPLLPLASSVTQPAVAGPLGAASERRISWAAAGRWDSGPSALLRLPRGSSRMRRVRTCRRVAKEPATWRAPTSCSVTGWVRVAARCGCGRSGAVPVRTPDASDLAPGEDTSPGRSTCR